MKSGVIWICVVALTALSAVAQNRPRAASPVGLVISRGATLVRGSQSIAVKPGEVLFSGDSLRTSDSRATFLFCPQKQSATLAPGSVAVLAEGDYRITSGSIQEQHPVAACFLPPAQKLSVASMQHYGVMLARSVGEPAPATTLAERMQGLPLQAREQLSADLDACASVIAQDPGDVAAAIGRAALFERAGLLFDASEAYRGIARNFPGLAWVAARLLTVEANLDQERLKKQ